MQLQYKALATGGTVHFSSMPGYLRARRAGSSACWVNTQPAQEALEQQEEEVSDQGRVTRHRNRMERQIRWARLPQAG